MIPFKKINVILKSSKLIQIQKNFYHIKININNFFNKVFLIKLRK